jgi:hypothetical protein
LPWQKKHPTDGSDGLISRFVSATPYFCPVHLSHGRAKAGRLRSITAELLKGLKLQGAIAQPEEIRSIYEIVFDYAPKELAETRDSIAQGGLLQPVPPRQFFPLIDPPQGYPPLPFADCAEAGPYKRASLKNPDDGFPFGASIGLTVDNGNRFIRAASFCRRRREHQAKGPGRMFSIEFKNPREPRPFAIGDQCHFGLGLFLPTESK